MRISDWSSDVCSSDLRDLSHAGGVDRRRRLSRAIDAQSLARTMARGRCNRSRGRRTAECQREKSIPVSGHDAQQDNGGNLALLERCGRLVALSRNRCGTVAPWVGKLFFGALARAPMAEGGGGLSPGKLAGGGVGEEGFRRGRIRGAP